MRVSLWMYVRGAGGSSILLSIIRVTETSIVLADDQVCSGGVFARSDIRLRVLIRLSRVILNFRFTPRLSQREAGFIIAAVGEVHTLRAAQNCQRAVFK